MKNSSELVDFISEEEKKFFAHAEIAYSKTKDEVWDLIQERMEEKQPIPQLQKRTASSFSWMKVGIAACFFMLVSAVLFAKYYSISVAVTPGRFTSFTLPDGSIVDMNADSEISYHPYWWNFERKVNLRGEAFFEVEKGKKFTVASKLGRTEVLGTKFNIYARDDDYQVYCLSGRVKVTCLASNKNVLLTRGEYIDTGKPGLKKESGKAITESVLSWRSDQLIFNTKPLSRVFADVGRQFDVVIKYDHADIQKYCYTGVLDKEMTPDEVLEIICYSFNLGIDKNQNNQYVIKKR